MDDAANKRNRLIVLVVLVVALVVAVVVVTAGGDDDDGGSTEISTDLSSKPDVPIPDGEPPTELDIIDVVEGDGAEAKAGDTVSVQYVGVNYSNGQQFDASWDSGQPFEFELGAGSVIPGWDQGVEGMKVGGRRELIIPPDLGYGAQGQPPDIPPNETLVFVIDLLDVQPGAAAGGGSGGE
jgi:peptidylprolyl isomerase